MYKSVPLWCRQSPSVVFFFLFFHPSPCQHSPIAMYVLLTPVLASTLARRSVMRFFSWRNFSNRSLIPCAMAALPRSAMNYEIDLNQTATPLQPNTPLVSDAQSRVCDQSSQTGCERAAWHRTLQNKSARRVWSSSSHVCVNAEETDTWNLCVKQWNICLFV